mgnify:CR=1 FL=1
MLKVDMKNNGTVAQPITMGDRVGALGCCIVDETGVSTVMTVVFGGLLTVSCCCSPLVQLVFCTVGTVGTVTMVTMVGIFATWILPGFVTISCSCSLSGGYWATLILSEPDDEEEDDSG